MHITSIVVTLVGLNIASKLTTAVGYSLGAAIPITFIMLIHGINQGLADRKAIQSVSAPQ